MTIWYARFASAHFEFEVTGTSKEDVDARMVEAIAVHCEQYESSGADIHAMLGDDETEWHYDWNARELELGYWYRDGVKQYEVLPPGHKWHVPDPDDDGTWDQAEEDARLRGALRDLER